MNTKNKIIAILMASIVAMAVGVPMVIGDEAGTSASVSTVAPTVDSVTITPDDDGTTPGVQIDPVANSAKTVIVTAQVSDPNGYSDINTVQITDINPDPTSGDPSPVTLVFQSGSGTTATYQGTFDMEFYDASTTYTVTVTATDASAQTGQKTATFDYTECIALDLDASTISFGSVAPGGSSSVAGDTVWNPPNDAGETIKNQGNVVIDIDPLSASDMCTDYPTCSGDKILNDNMYCGFTTGDYSVNLANPTSSDLNLAAAASSLNLVNFKLDVPEGTPTGSYSGSVILTAKKSTA